MIQKLNLKSKINKETMMKIVVMTLVFTVSIGYMVLAADNGPARNISNWLMSGVQVIALALVAVFAVKFLIKRQIVQFISFALLAGLILVFIYDPTKLKSIGDYFYGIIFG